MNANYLILLDYCAGEILKIKLDETEKQKAETFINYEDFILTLESKYNFRLKDCLWMSVENLSERSYF